MTETRSPKLEKVQWIGIAVTVLGLAMALSVPFTPKVIWDWFTPCSIGNCSNQPTTVMGNFENGLAHLYLYTMLFGGFFLAVRGIFWALPSVKVESRNE